jgi:hypothetical protein
MAIGVSGFRGDGESVVFSTASLLIDLGKIGCLMAHVLGRCCRAGRHDGNYFGKTSPKIGLNIVA